jgi:hypothetical protein
MPHPVVYPKEMNALVNEWDEKYKQAWNEHGKDGLRNLRIGSGECVALPQGLTSVGYTGRWQRGDRVVDVAKTLKPGTVIANFKLIDGKWQYPRPPGTVHGYHAALFLRGESYISGAPETVNRRVLAACTSTRREVSNRAIRLTNFTWCWCHEMNTHRITTPVVGRRAGRGLSVPPDLPWQRCASRCAHGRDDELGRAADQRTAFSLGLADGRRAGCAGRNGPLLRASRAAGAALAHLYVWRT